MVGLRRSQSAPRLIQWSIPGPEFTHKAARPWTPINPPLERFTLTKDIDIFEILNSDDLRQFQSIVEEMGLIACSTFVNVLRSLSVKANDRQMARLFDKIDVKASGYITWDDVTAFIIQSQHLRDKENRQANENKFHFRIQPLTHKDRITRIEIIQNNSDVAIGSSDGVLSLWTRDLKPKRQVKLTSKGKYQPARRKWYTDFMFLHDVGKIVASTGFCTVNISLAFKVITCSRTYKNPVNEMDTLQKLPDTNQNALIWGDSNGNISILQLTDFADLLRRWRSMQQMNAPPTISISSLVMDQKISFVRWKTHDEWVAKVKLVETDAIFKLDKSDAVQLSRANGLTPPMRVDSILGRRRRDLMSSTTSSEFKLINY
ncbi:hypothetical protein ACTXT7_011476 [Hymenolepis weldensis]